jgi:hypothetical protein
MRTDMNICETAGEKNRILFKFLQTGCGECPQQISIMCSGNKIILMYQNGPCFGIFLPSNELNDPWTAL